MILIFVSILKILDSNNIRIEYADSRRPKIPNLFNIFLTIENVDNISRNDEKRPII